MLLSWSKDIIDSTTLSYRPASSAVLVYFVDGGVFTKKELLIKLFIVIMNKMLTMLCKSSKKEEKLEVID
jgi:hypothetical protein